jgi:hypothetical protein
MHNSLLHQREVDLLVTWFDLLTGLAMAATGEIYWLSRAQDIVAEYTTLETRWTTEEAEEKLREAQYKAEREAKEQQERLEREKAQRTH